MQEVAVDIAQVLLVALPAAWLTLGVYDNLRYPDINRRDVAKVLDLEAITDEPMIYEKIKSRRIKRPETVRRIFACVAAAEAVVALALWLACVGLALAVLGVMPRDLATGFAILATLAFIMIWAGFLIGGQWFYYWYGAFGQWKHFTLVLWGIVTLIVLTL